MSQFDLPASSSPFADACRRLLSTIAVPPTLAGVPVVIDPACTTPEFRTPGRPSEPLKLVPLVLVLVLVGGVPLLAVPKWVVNVTCGAAATTAFTEIVLTESCLQRGTCEETNPFLPHGTTKGDSLTRSALKGAGAASVVRLAYVPKSRWTRIGICGSYAAFNAYLTSRAWRRLP